MTTAIEIAKKIIVESQQVGRQEMSQRRTNSGVAGEIAEKVTRRTKYDDNFEPLTLDQQAEKLAEWLDEKEIEYAKNVWK